MGTLLLLVMLPGVKYTYIRTSVGGIREPGAILEHEGKNTYKYIVLG